MRTSAVTVSILLSLLLVACGPATSIHNDTKSPIYVDLISKGVPRSPSPQLVKPGDGITGPWCHNTVARIYIGVAPSALRSLDMAGRCSPGTCSCTIYASQLLAADRH